MTWLLVPLAFAAMFMQDVLCVWLVQAEAERRAHAAGNWDMAADVCRMAWLYAGGDALLVSHDLPLRLAVIAATLAADRLGTYTGVRLSARIEQRKPPVPAPAAPRVTFDGGNEQQFAAWLRKQIRINGGGP